MTIETLLHALGARRSGASWIARCPAHDDHNPSLSIREAHGKILLHCHAGCAQDDVIAALKKRGLWERQSRARRRRAEYTYEELAQAELLRIGLRWRIDRALALAKSYLDGAQHELAALTVRAWTAFDAAIAARKLSHGLVRACVEEAAEALHMIATIVHGALESHDAA